MSDHLRLVWSNDFQRIQPNETRSGFFPVVIAGTRHYILFQENEWEVGFRLFELGLSISAQLYAEFLLGCVKASAEHRAP